MKQPVVRRVRLCGLAAGALLVTGLTAAAPPASALPVFTLAHMSMSSDGYTSSVTPCTVAKNASPELFEVPLAENGAPTSVSSSVSGTVSNNADATDVISFATSAIATGRVTSVGGNPGVIELASNGNIEGATSKPTSACEVTAYSGGYMSQTFAVAQAGFMTFATKADRHAFGEVNLSTDSGARYFDVTGSGLNFSGTKRVHLLPGTYVVYYRAEHHLASASTSVPSAPSSLSIKGSFDVAGSRTRAVSGKGRKYVTFPAIRSCATDSVDAAVTLKRKRAKQIRKLTFLVNDAKVRSLKSPTMGHLVKLPVAGEADAEVRAEVTLKPTKPGRKPKTHEVTAGYIACSAG